MAPRAILHVDLDAFFVAVERLKDPSLAGRPVVVGADPRGGRGRGVVAAASYEARTFGIRSAMPIGEAYRRCPDAAWLRGSPDLYRRAARAVRGVFHRYTPAVEPVSIDEAYLDLTGTERLHGPPRATAERIRRAIAAEVRLPVSMGLATTKAVAKIASDLCKPEGFLEIWPGREAAFLAPLPLDRMPGIGPATRERLWQFNLRTLGDLARLDPQLATGVFGDYGASLAARARGADERGVSGDAPPKSVSRECTFEEDTADVEFCESMLWYLSERAARDLRSHRLTARTVALKLRYRDFTTVVRSHTLATPTDSERRVAGVARDLFRAAYARRVSVRLLGVGLSNLVVAAPQLDLFAAPRELAWERLIGPLDDLRDRFGFGAVRAGSSILLARETDAGGVSRAAAHSKRE
ncbi:MAG TPA: DNA polymerase IV [Gemmatimonadota bacterium]|nr:DNA polymerase IV [Gemmatimonadota bacterium]